MAKKGYRVSVIHFVIEVENDLVEFAGELVRIPSVTGNEGGVATALLAKLQSIGVDESWIDEAGNVIGVPYGSNYGPNILLSGHLDVVPPGRQDSWDFDPFVGDIDQKGRLRGRGSTDMKGRLAALVFAMKLMKDLRSEFITLMKEDEEWPHMSIRTKRISSRRLIAWETGKEKLSDMNQ